MDYYEKLSRDIEAGKITPDDSTMARDPQAGERLLLQAAGAETWEQLAQDAENGLMTPDPNREALHGEAAAEAGPVLPAHHGRPRQTPLWGTSAPGQYG